MKSVKTIKPQDWMTAPQTLRVMKTLGDGHALFVGGCVRNALLGEEVDDIDIATKLTPTEVTRVLEAEGIKVVPTGILHGTVTAVCDDRVFEITTLRKDVETDGRRAVVAFTDDWRKDAERRDFTMNTLLADTAGNIFDPTGKGIDDLEARKVVFVGKAETRIAEDYLRILRFFRFHARFGKGEPDELALKACRAASAQIASLSVERVTQEFLRILTVDQPDIILNIMFKNNILNDFSYPKDDLEFLKHFCTFQNRYSLGFLASRLLVLADLKLENIADIDKKMLIPKVFKKDIEAISKALELPDLKTDHAVQVAIYKHGRVATAQALMIELVQDRVMNGYAPKALEIIQKWDIPDFPVSGDDLMNAGIKPGPQLGRKLAELEDWWIAGGFKADKAVCLKEL